MKIKIITNTEHTEQKIKQLTLTNKKINQLINNETILYKQLKEKMIEHYQQNHPKYHNTLPFMEGKYTWNTSKNY